MGATIRSGIGFTLHAYDVKTGTALWRTTIDGLGKIEPLGPSLVVASAFPADAKRHGERSSVLDMRDGSTKWNAYEGFAYSDAGAAAPLATCRCECAGMRGCQLWLIIVDHETRDDRFESFDLDIEMTSGVIDLS